MSDNRTDLAQLQEFERGLSERERELVATERTAAGMRLSAHPRPEGVLAAAENAGARSGERRHALALLQPRQESACHAGCHCCCYLKVGATAAEVLLLAEYLRQHLPPDVLARVQAHAAQLAQDPRIFSEDLKAAAKIACPVLTEAGTCAGYPARPLACRGWNSLDAAACRAWLDDDSALPPSDVQLARDYAAVGLGLSAALSDAGLCGEILELTSALHVALSEPRALERWTGGEALFSVARADGRAAGIDS